MREPRGGRVVQVLTLPAEKMPSRVRALVSI